MPLDTAIYKDLYNYEYDLSEGTVFDPKNCFLLSERATIKALLLERNEWLSPLDDNGNFDSTREVKRVHAKFRESSESGLPLYYAGETPSIGIYCRGTAGEVARTLASTDQIIVVRVEIIDSGPNHVIPDDNVKRIMAEFRDFIRYQDVSDQLNGYSDCGVVSNGPDTDFDTFKSGREFCSIGTTSFSISIEN